MSPAARRYALDPVVETGVVFVHVPKTGGTSVARALYGTDGGGHRTLGDYCRELGADWVEGAFSFAVVRDPVERLASAVRYLRAGGQNRLDAAFGRDVLARFDTLDDFVCGWLTPETAQGQVHLRPQADGDPRHGEELGPGALSSPVPPPPACTISSSQSGDLAGRPL